MAKNLPPSTLLVTHIKYLVSSHPKSQPSWNSPNRQLLTSTILEKAIDIEPWPNATKTTDIPPKKTSVFLKFHAKYLVCNPYKISRFFSSQVSYKLKLAESTAIDIDNLREGYRPVAKRGALLFFVFSDISNVNPMYQYSLESYLEVRKRIKIITM
jgi:hypothetical protein